MRKQMVEASRSGLFFAVFVLAAALLMPAVGWAEKSTDPGGGPPDGKGRKPPAPGGSIKGDILGDLWVVVRNLETGGNGRPIHFSWQWPQQYYDETGALVIPAGGLPTGYTEGGESVCVQPISYTRLQPAPKADGTQYSYQYLTSYGNPRTVYLIPLDAECNIPDVYAATWGTYVTEVDSGRLALARTTQYVLDAAYEEAVTALNGATSVTPDPAGRLLIGLQDGTQRVIDSPRENLALYQRLMKYGCLSPTANVTLTNTGIFQSDFSNLLCTDSVTQPDDLDLQVAASFLAGAADKTGDIGVDEIIYLNSILGINTVQKSPTDGSLIVTGYLDFGDFTYWRGNTYEGKAADLLQPSAVSSDGRATSYAVVYNFPFAAAVFGTDAGVLKDWNEFDQYGGYPVINFVRASDDALSVVFYIHNYELPTYPVPIEAEETVGNTLQRQNPFQQPVPAK